MICLLKTFIIVSIIVVLRWQTGFQDINITNYLIIDDDSDFLPEQDNNIVHPDIMNGMLMEHYLECCKICHNFK